MRTKQQWGRVKSIQTIIKEKGEQKKKRKNMVRDD